MANVRLYSAQVSRRALLQSAAAGVAAAATQNSAFAKAKASQAAVAYQDYPHGSERCDNCAVFIPPNQCKTVVGPVSPQGWCKIYVPK
jgi:hypothetical protein